MQGTDYVGSVTLIKATKPYQITLEIVAGDERDYVHVTARYGWEGSYEAWCADEDAALELDDADVRFIHREAAELEKTITSNAKRVAGGW